MRTRDSQRPMVRLLTMIPLIVVALMAAACSSGDPSGGSGGGLTGESAELAYAQCMREHGIDDWPDPVLADGEWQFRLPDGFDLESPEFVAAETACSPERQDAEPGTGAGSPEEQEALEAEMEAMLEFAACMRDQGVDFPDPVLEDSSISGPAGPLDGDWDGFNEAREICEEETGAPMP